MYHLTDYEIINGSHLTAGVITGGFFPTLAQVDDYQRVLNDYFQKDYEQKITVFVNYKRKI
jgi:hypothetical protein